MDGAALFLSLKVSAAATAISISVGLPLAWLSARRRVVLRPLFDGLLLMPLVLPPTVLGYYLLVALGPRSPLGIAIHTVLGHSLVFTWQGAAVAAAAVSCPLLLLTARAAFASIDPDLLSAAQQLGANELQAVWFVALPLARRGITAGIVLAFARALGDFGATLMVAGDIPGVTRTMPLAVYDAYYGTSGGSALGLVLLLTAVAFVVAGAAGWLGATSSVLQRREHRSL